MLENTASSEQHVMLRKPDSSGHLHLRPSFRAVHFGVTIYPFTPPIGSPTGGLLQYRKMTRSRALGCNIPSTQETSPRLPPRNRSLSPLSEPSPSENRMDELIIRIILQATLVSALSRTRCVWKRATASKNHTKHSLVIIRQVPHQSSNFTIVDRRSCRLLTSKN